MNGSPSELELRETSQGTILKVKVNPGARRNAITGVQAGALRISVTAAPDKGKANKAVIELLAKHLAVPKTSVVIERGQTSSQKRFLVGDVSPDEVRRRLLAFLN